MYGYGLFITISVLTLFLMIVVNTCTDWPVEGFATKEIPRPLNITDHSLKNVTGVSSVTDLPSAPISGLSDVNSLPQTDPAMEKGTLQMLNELEQDMAGFYKNEYPYIKDRSDPAINLPLTRFVGDYQRVKDEMSVLKANPGIPAQISIQEINDVGANLRYLQRTYRNLADVELVPATTETLSRIGTEGFANPDDMPISLDKLKLLNKALEAEITRLKASGTTDPVINARVNIFTQMKQSVNDLVTSVANGSMAASAIPIKEKDYKNFLPSLGKSTGPIGSLISKKSQSTPSTPAEFMDKYMDKIINGISFSYTSPNDIAKIKAMASYANISDSSQLNPRGLRVSDSRGEFDDKIRILDAFETIDTFENGGNSIRPPSEISGNPGSFDWKKRAIAITENIKRAGLNAEDYGCLQDTSSVGKEFSWRGHAKMVCSRLSANADPGAPEQMGCPPVSWKGWRS
jgi:hypothetical protein